MRKDLSADGHNHTVLQGAGAQQKQVSNQVSYSFHSFVNLGLVSSRILFIQSLPTTWPWGTTPSFPLSKLLEKRSQSLFDPEDLLATSMLNDLSQPIQLALVSVIQPKPHFLIP